MISEVWYNKQNPRNLTESPQSNLGFSGTPNTNEGIKGSQAIGYGFAAARLIPAGKQIFSTFINATGDKRLQKNVKRAGTAIAIGTELATVGVYGTLAIEGTKLIVNIVSNNKQDSIDTINQEYDIQKVGVSVNKFVGVGERLD